MTDTVRGTKLLLTGLSNSGKTSALSSLDPEKTLVISIDGKLFPLPIPHANFAGFPDVNGFIFGYDTTDGGHVKGIVDKINQFEETFGAYPEVIVIDTISRVANIIADNCMTKYTSYDIHTNISKQNAEFNKFVESQLIAAGISVVTTTHVTYDEKVGAYTDASSGAYKKTGGILSVHDHVSFFHVDGKKYKVSHRVPGLPCRTLLSEEELPSVQLANDYSLADHLTLLRSKVDAVKKFSLD